MYDCIIIGKGPAGISASLYIKRAGLNCLVIGKEEGSLLKAHKIENYYGLETPISGEELFDIGIKQAEGLGIKVKQEEVLSIQMEQDKEFSVITTQNEYQARTVIIATGTNRKKPNIKGIKEFEGKGISYCAICDAFFYRNKNVAVLGNGEYALHEIETLLPVVNKVTLLTNGKEAIENRSSEIEVLEKPIKEVRGTRSIDSAIFEDNTSIHFDGLFIAEGSASSTDFARKLGIFLENDKIVVDENQKTNIDGLYAAGDCTGGTLQISKAVYDGTKAAFGVISYLKK